MVRMLYYSASLIIAESKYAHFLNLFIIVLVMAIEENDVELGSMDHSGPQTKPVPDKEDEEKHSEVEAEPEVGLSFNDDVGSIKSTEAISEVTTDALDGPRPNGQFHENGINENGDNEDKTPTEQDLNPDLNRFMVACQQGNLHIVQDMIDNKTVQANDTFSDGITGLHWAAINNRSSAVRYLVENTVSAADPNKLGGELMASPLHWACRNGLVYIVHYLVEHGANPLLKDNQAYNALHLSIHSSNIMLVIYVLYRFCSPEAAQKGQCYIYVDEPDNFNRTSLHWACYQGDILSVQALLKFGADVNKVDNSKFIPLHWSFMKAYKPLLKLLVQEGSDIFAKNELDKDSFAIANDMNCYNVWIRVLNECHRYSKNDWQLKPLRLDESLSKKITFLTPYFILPIILHLLNFTSPLIVVNVFFSILTIFVTNFVLRNFVVVNYVPDKNFLKTPIAAGIFSSTLFWVSISYLFTVFPSTLFLGLKSFVVNLILIPTIASVIYCFYKSMTLNPGLVPIPTDNTKIYQQIVDLINVGKFNSDFFCVSSFIRKPLRSKYSQYNKHLVARFDHFCPWVFNEIGVRNHKIFIMFTYSLHLGIILWSYLALTYFHNLEKVLESTSEGGYDSELEESCNILSESLCIGYSLSNFKFNLLVWCWIQFMWLTLLVFSQTFQILKGVTTYEFANLSSNISINHSTLPRDFIPLSSSVDDNYNGSIVGGLDSVNQSPNQTSNHGHAHNSSNACFRLLGIDQFILTLKINILSLLNKNTSNEVIELSSVNNPTDYGLKQNWLDFWFLGDVKFRNIFYLPLKGENNLNGKLVDYYTLYELPPKRDMV